MKPLPYNLQSLAFEVGFPLVGLVPSRDAEGFPRFCEWLDQNYHGSMSYLQTRRDAYRNPDSILEGCKTVIMLGMPYQPHPETWPSKQSGKRPQPPTPECRIGSYSMGSIDYHLFLREQLNDLIAQLRPVAPSSRWRGVVDTAPLLERDFARLAGLGWIGKNTLLLNRQWGSYFFLAAILTDWEWPVSETTVVSDHCGSCTACLDACPTQAFPKAYVLDATKCISYLTIEHRGSIEPELREKMGNWLFGCDICQIVCPWNRRRDGEVLEVFFPSSMEQKTSLEHWLTLDEDEFRRSYKNTPFSRPKLRGMQRNAIIAAANSERYDLLPLIEALCQSVEGVVAETAQWAVQRLKRTSAKELS